MEKNIEKAHTGDFNLSLSRQTTPAYGESEINRLGYHIPVNDELCKLSPSQSLVHPAVVGKDPIKNVSNDRQKREELK